MALVAVAVLVVSSGCSKSASPEAAAPKPTTTTGGATCAAGETANAESAFCIKLPAGQKPAKLVASDAKSHTYDYESASGPSIRIVALKMDSANDWDEEVKFHDDDAKATGRTLKESTDLPGGGKYWLSKDANDFDLVMTLSHKDTALFFCSVQGLPLDQTVIDACKSVHPL